MKGQFAVLLLLSISLVGACTQKVSPITVEKENIPIEELLQQMATQHFEKDYRIQYNASKSFASISKEIKTRKNQIFPTLSFLLYDIQQKKILHREVVARAQLKWISDTAVEIAVTPGMVDDSGDTKAGFIYDVTTGQKRQR